MAMVPEWIALVALALGGLVGLSVGFLLGVDSASQVLARRWLELHPGDGPLPLAPRWWR